MEAIKKKFELTRDMKFQFVSLVLINQMINFQNYFSTSLNDDDMFLGDYLKFMQEKGLVTTKGDKFIPTSKGRKCLVNFYDKYFEFLKVFDIYCAVDLEKGEFAFANMFENMNDEEWKDFLNEERFSDVRVAVAEFKNINPLEVVFMSFLNEGRFETNERGWQIALTKEGVWNEIEDICNTAISLEHLQKNDAIQDIVKQGTDLMFEILKHDEELKQEEQNMQQEAQEEIVETTIVEEYEEIVEPPYYSYAYFRPYEDIYYVSPFWVVPFIF